jgi:EAL domain-containing protein (putative c-di-GMP-specific phosphodiesterase class I)
MPLRQLVNYFNQRFVEEQNLTRPPLILWDERVEGESNQLRFGSVLQPVQAYPEDGRVIGLDASLQVLETLKPVGALPDLVSALREGSTHDTVSALSRWGESDLSDHRIVHLDRLSRTVHMLNFLVFSHEVRSLFLTVHPRHILAVDKEHGAYFEEIILRCGLSTRRIVITLPVTRAYHGQATLLLNRLKNYRDRGYATALRFEEAFNRQHYQEFLERFTPDFARFHWNNLQTGLARNPSLLKDRNLLLNRLRQRDTLIVVDGIHTAADADQVEHVRPDAVQGQYYRQSSPSLLV